MIKSTPRLDKAIERYCEADWDEYEDARLHLLRVAWDIGWAGNRKIELDVYIGFAIIEAFYILRDGKR